MARRPRKSKNGNVTLTLSRSVPKSQANAASARARRLGWKASVKKAAKKKRRGLSLASGPNFF